MPFSAATCLTTIPLNVTSFNIFLGENNYNTVFDTVSVSDITQNCPYIVDNIPDGTTHLSFKDSTGIYCFSIPVQSNDICIDCNLGFSNYSGTTIGKLSCGVLTGSCENIEDYLIYWYGPDDTMSLSFTSGSGIYSTPVSEINHPFDTFSTSFPRTSGVYTPVINKIRISGLTFSVTGGTGIYFTGNCLPTTTILPYSCTGKTNNTNLREYSAYTNSLEFFSVLSEPLPVQTSYILSSNTKYIVWNFSGASAPDNIKLEFSGSSYYPNIIGIDDFTIGGNLTDSFFSSSTYPKSASTSQSFTKFSCLTGLTVNDGDILKITVSPFFNDTNWKLYISCLDDYNCNDCLTTQNYKISGSTITHVLKPCNSVFISFKVSGCSSNDQNSDFILYNLNSDGLFNTKYTNVLSDTSIIDLTTISDGIYFQKIRCGLPGSFLFPSQSPCTFDTSTTNYNRTFLNDGTNRCVFGFTGSSNFISTYYNSLQNAFSGLTPYSTVFSGSPNPNDISYYRYYSLKIPSQTTPLNLCNDNNTFINVFLHHTSPYVTGLTGSDYYLLITAATISNVLSFNTCDSGCLGNVLNVVNTVNNSSTGSTPANYSRTFPGPNGIYYQNPINRVDYVTSADTRFSAATFSGFFNTPDYAFNTYPFSGNPSTIIPSFSGGVCNYNSTGVKSVYKGSYENRQYKFIYQIRLTNPNDLNDFDIWASPINNLSFSGAPSTAQYELAYRYSGGSVIYSASTYII